MKITKISVFAANLVEVRTDAGLIGYGEGKFCEELLRQQPDLAIGRSPFEAEAIFEELSADGASPGGLDLALWDLMGKSLGKPVCQILGKPYRGKVLACPSVCEIGQAPEHRAIRVETRGQLRRCQTRVGLKFTLPNAEDALAAGERFQDAGLEFWESPIPGNDPEGYARLKSALRISLAAGPSISMDALGKDYIQTELVDLVIQDVATCGLTGLRKLSYLCWLFHVRLVPCCAGTPLATAAALHAAACIPPVSNALNTPPVFFISGGLPEIEPAVPSCPGLGVEIQSPCGAPQFVLGGER